MAKWNEVPIVAKLGIVLGLAAVVCVCMYFLVFKSTYDENKQKLEQLKAKTAENERLAKNYEPRLTEVNRRIELLKQQLEIQKRIVPDEKEAADFIHLLQERAAASGVEIRRYTANLDSVATREFYTEVPYEVELDGPYYAVLDFFSRVGRMERIINVSSLKMGGISSKASIGRRKYAYLPGETVVATCTATTFFSHDAQQITEKPGTVKK